MPLMPHTVTLMLALTLAASAAARTPPPAAQNPPVPAPAAPPGGPGGPGRGGPRGPVVVSPEIGPDRTVTLRYLAPNATQVTASGELDGKPHPMTKGADGIWSVTIGPLAPDIYTYAFNVDGVVALDPRNVNTKYGYGNFGAVSVVQVPGDAPAFYDVKDVPHGEVRIKPYVSKALGVTRTAWIYTPPGYDKGARYPVMYLLHGAGDIESGWTMIGRANNILDNLIAEGKAKPMVVVMPLGHAIQSFWTGPAKGVPPPATSAAGAAPPPAIEGAFFRDFLTDLMPMVERDYKVSARAEDRAIAGLSMGGGQTLTLAFSKPELFRYVAAMSAAAFGITEARYPAHFKDPSLLNKQFKVFWVGIGKDDGLTGPSNTTLNHALTKAGITHTYVLGEGRHEWSVWRNHLREVAPLLFK
jgi:enterochelin esterase family protein